jgi:NAD(P)-dependent dehydrogenase (short-subunit alcohol dehydrogenase family)
MCTPFSLTPQNHEIQLQTNYLSHHLLTSLLLPNLLSTITQPNTPPNTVRVINVSSDGHKKLAPKTGIQFQDINLENKSTWTRYGHSKLCNVLHSLSLSQKYGTGKGGLVAVSLHPGTVKTGLSQGPRNSTPMYRIIQPLVEWGAPGPKEGCTNILWCAVSSELGALVEKGEGNGAYFEPVGKRGGVSECGKDEEIAERLWLWTEACLKKDGFL